MTTSTCIVVGGGSVGANLALFLDSWGFDVTLVELQDDILLGAAQTTFLNHGDGFEYYKKGHIKTGEYCIEGSLTKAVIYPLDTISTGVCSEENPIRFLVAKGAVMANRISKHGFLRNAQHMMKHYTQMFHALRDAMGLSENEARNHFIRAPREFMRPLCEPDFSDISEAVAGANGNGFGVNMPHYYSLLKQALRKSRVTCRFGVNIDRIHKTSNGEYRAIAENGTSWQAQQIFICSSHHIPELAYKIRNAAVTSFFPGTYYLNSMTFLRLPATSDPEKRKAAKKINFTLMEEWGCMYACIVPPTATRDGVAAVYYPHSRGSQRTSHVSPNRGISKPPVEWDTLVKNGLPNDDVNVVNTFQQACRLYPFLNDYATVTHSVCRTVFNVAVRGSNGGQDRRVRELSPARHLLTADGQISAWTAPKWTNCELTALMALDYALRVSGRPRLPTSHWSGCGPTKLDVARIAERLCYRSLTVNAADARRYARASGLPVSMVDTPNAATDEGRSH